MVAHLGFRHRRRFVRGRQDAVNLLRQTDASDGAGIDNARAAGSDGGLDHVSRAFDVRRIHRRVITQPEMVTCGDVEAPITAVHRSDKFLAVAYVAIDAFEVGAFQSAQIACRPQQRLHWMAEGEQFVNKVCTDETRRPRDKASHGGVIDCSVAEIKSISRL